MKENRNNRYLFINCEGIIGDLERGLGYIRRDAAVIKEMRRNDELAELSEQLMNLKNKIDEVIQDIMP